jgi:hypothetical protein
MGRIRAANPDAISAITKRRSKDSKNIFARLERGDYYLQTNNRYIVNKKYPLYTSYDLLFVTLGNVLLFKGASTVDSIFSQMCFEF